MTTSRARQGAQIVSDAISIICNLEHAARSAPIRAPGDGAGYWFDSATPLARKAQGNSLVHGMPRPGEYAIGARSCQGNGVAPNH